MQPRMPVPVAAVCTLLCGVVIAQAERRSVAVIDMSADQKTADLARALNPVLLGHPDLQPLTDPQLTAELIGTFQNDDMAIIREAQAAFDAAEQSLGRYSFDVAFEGSKSGQDKLRTVVPTAGGTRLYAKLAFVNGQALLGMPRQAADAPRMFVLANRLDPSFVPDIARYLPDVIQAFDAAKRRWVGKGTVTIAGTGKLWIDGREEGMAPAERQLEAGPHVIWLTGDDRIPVGREIQVEADKPMKVEIADAPASLLLKVRRARADLRNAQDPTTRAVAMKKLAALLGRGGAVRDAVLLSSANGKIIFQTWNAGTRKHAPGFSALRELKNEAPVDLLAPLAPPKPKDEPRLITFDKPVVDNRRWFERRTWQATLAAGAVAAVIVGYYVYKGATDDDFVVGNPEPEGRTTLGVSW